jgi:MFS family permease
MGTINFVISMFYRSTTAVISPALIKEMGFNSAQLSDLSAVFFYSFAVSQLPMGVAFDRLGVRRTMSFLAIAAVGGAVVFALGRTPNQLVLGRALLGIGMSGNLMAVLALVAVWFPVNRFAFLIGVIVSLGTLGSLLAATPLAVMSLSIGWRNSFLVFAGINLVVVLVFLHVARDHPQGRSPATRESGSVYRGLGRLFAMYSYWAISLSSFVRYGYFAALQSLWVGPFLIYGLGLGEIAASNVILCMGIGYMVALPLSGWLSDRVFRSRKKVVLASLIGFCVFTLSTACLTPASSIGVILVVFFALGFAAAPGQIMYAHIKELLPSEMIAQAMTAVNLFTVLGAGVITQALGLLIGAEPSHLAGVADFSLLWYVGVALLAVVCFLYILVPDSSALGLKDS